MLAPGSSPHTRGAQESPEFRFRDLGIIPAYAGSTQAGASLRIVATDHPRIRGEHGWVSCVSWTRAGSSPHTRGARPSASASIWGSGIIPAYAGSTRARAGIPHLVQDHPRIRGEHGCRAVHSLGGLGSSPHTRGAHERGSHRVVPFGIIPAYAGSTVAVGPGRCVRRDHPRIRGEHRGGHVGGPGGGGSSPHTRGAHRPLVLSVAPGRIIPAYAGSTSW